MGAEATARVSTYSKHDVAENRSFLLDTLELIPSDKVATGSSHQMTAEAQRS